MQFFTKIAWLVCWERHLGRDRSYCLVGIYNKEKSALAQLQALREKSPHRLSKIVPFDMESGNPVELFEFNY